MWGEKKKKKIKKERKKKSRDEWLMTCYGIDSLIALVDSIRVNSVEKFDLKGFFIGNDACVCVWHHVYGCDLVVFE